MLYDRIARDAIGTRDEGDFALGRNHGSKGWGVRKRVVRPGVFREYYSGVSSSSRDLKVFEGRLGKDMYVPGQEAQDKVRLVPPHRDGRASRGQVLGRNCRGKGSMR